ncbi:Alpha/Beta hydrolase protein [Boeremia exigua]|uniref:Alpha/Beta hydrolase protein n=1 Tax=Boeremia exigua TaxID=749465 RepID=UPI001E8DECB6|nr:Alpha/Beta hydrolase protein [Boeremia exigua]KAH6629592.1 Alpha/Beta hydrolase protein [Boeremia exigua]
MSILKVSQLIALLSTLAQCHPTSGGHKELLVHTGSFTVQGVAWPNSTDVSFWGNIPYAEPPIGELRFRPPVTKSATNKTIDGSWFGPSCIQYSNGQKTVYSEYLKGFLLTPGQVQSEDCLTLNVWAPSKKRASEKLPVMIWIHGGGFTSGGAASPYKYGDRLAKDQNVIVVALNYRLNIFGYPNAAALDGRHLNPGLLDQRKAVEWTYNNIAGFGGDPERMVLFGQSAGGMAVDKYAYAYPEDPIVKGFIAQSGTSSGGASNDPTNSNFTYLASQVGCTDTGNDEIFSCMQKANATAIIEVLNKYNATANGGRGLSFNPSPDNITSFSNYTDRQLRGRFAKVPTILAQVNNEGASLVAYVPSGPNQTAVDAFTRNIATCPGAKGALARKTYNVPVWRTRYFGEWPNLNPLPWLGAYHSSDIPMVFGTSDLLGPDTPAEAATSKYIQDAWAAFARDPEKGITWAQYDPNADTLVKLGFENNTQAVYGPGDEFDALC